MLFDTTVKKCKCDQAAGFTEASFDSCVLISDYDKLVSEGYVPDNYFIVTYYDVANSKGTVSEPKSVNSDVFKQFYIK